MADGEFTYKGRGIEVTTKGEFRFYSKAGKFITKPSLKGAQNAIDKDLGTITVEAMSREGVKVEIVGKHRSGGGYLNSNGHRVGHYGGRLLTWDQDAATKLVELCSQLIEEGRRHGMAQQAINEQRVQVLRALATFDYDAAVVAAVQRDEAVGKPAE